MTTVADTLSINRGQHFIRIGGEFRLNEVLLAQEQFTRGQLDFTDFKSFLNGSSSNSTLGDGIGSRRQRAFDYNFFLQDDWKASARLTFNFGVRYELDCPYTTHAVAFRLSILSFTDQEWRWTAAVIQLVHLWAFIQV